MAVFGKIDAKALANNVDVVNGDATVTLASGSFLNAATNNYINQGDILVLSGVSYIVQQVTDATHLELHTTYAGSTATITAANAIRRTAPKAVARYVVQGGDSFTGTLYFVDTTEAVLNENRVRGIDGPGWWVYKTYVDNDGNTRHKAEKIADLSVAAATSGDWTDDTKVADVASAITISGQPSNQSTRTPAGAVLTFTSAGTAAAGTGSYTINGSTAGNVVTNVSGGAAPAASGYEYTVSRAAGVYTVTVVTGGSGFAATDTILVKGSELGGADTTNDLTITVSTVATAAATFSVTAAASTGSLVYQWQRRTSSTAKWANVSGATSSSLALTALTTASTGYQYRVKLNSSVGAEEVISDTATLTVTAA